MSIAPNCDKCKKELTEYGGLLFAPPGEDDRARKWHLCKNCYEIIVKDFNK